ncbi:hypothetical protein VP01_4608g1 [Puccinia sorghi]|uniref:Uncharacterized protein n=1 Tax=Puccinia sorghi TaxID=27349 RepID=A0A0L6UNH4_9BASI|nr:hypothetical protein VP01_4608g1 [Puccinia sorghi]
MNKLSEAYAKLTPEEKAALAKSATPTDTLVEELINCPDQMGTTFNQQPPPQTQPGHQRTQADCTLTAKELALDDLSEDDAQLPSNSAPTMLHYLLAVNIAQTCNCEVVLFAVTKHLSKHSLNFSRWTPGAKESHQKISDLDGNMHYSARLQALINGNTVKNHAVAQKFPGMKSKFSHSSKVCLIPSVIASLVYLLFIPQAKKTNQVLTAWPWTNTDSKLKEAKITNRNMRKIPVTMLLLDLQQGHIKVLPIPEGENDAGSQCGD